MKTADRNKEASSTRTGTGNATNLQGRCKKFAIKNAMDPDEVYAAQSDFAKKEDAENQAAKKEQEAKDAKAKKE